jgi:hypothetical protein
MVDERVARGSITPFARGVQSLAEAPGKLSSGKLRRAARRRFNPARPMRFTPTSFMSVPRRAGILATPRSFGFDVMLANPRVPQVRRLAMIGN